MISANRNDVNNKKFPCLAQNRGAMVEVMMKKTVIILIMFLFTLGLFGADHWRKVGQPLSKERCYNPTLSFDSDGELFVGFREQEYKENTNGLYHASVKKYDSISKTWLSIGEPKFSPELIGSSQGNVPLSFVISNDKLYVAFVTGGSETERKVMTYNGKSEEWDFVASNLPEGSQYTLLKADNKGNLYIAFESQNGMQVMSSVDAVDWDYYGVHPTDISSNEGFRFIVSSQGVPFLSTVTVKPDYVSEAVITHCNEKSEEWAVVGDIGFSGNLGDEYKVSELAIDKEQQAFVGFTEANDNNAKVMKYDVVLNKWELLPDSNFTGEYIMIDISTSNSSALFASLRMGVEKKIKIMKYNTSLSKWEMVGEEINKECSVPVFNSADVPFISCTDSDGILTVLTYDDQPDDPDTGDTADTGNTANTADSTDSGNTADTADSGDTGNTGNTADTGNSADSSDDGSACSVLLI